VGRVLGVGIALAAHLAVGFLYAAAGLVVPGLYLFGLWAIWGALAVVGVLAVRRRRPVGYVLAVPVAAIVILMAVVSAGGALLNWQA